MKRIILVTVLLLFSMIVGSTQAQNASAPIILLVSGDLWSWDGVSSSLKQLTNTGFQDTMSISPDGKQLAYTSTPQFAIDAMNAAGPGATLSLPEDVSVMDVASGSSRTIAPQPADAAVTQGVPFHERFRSKPAWSPDGTMLAWTEFASEDSVQHVTIYNLATGASQVIVPSLPQQYVLDSMGPQDIFWVKAGIVIHSTTHDDATNAFDESFLVYAPTGAPITTIAAGHGDLLMDWFPMTSSGQDELMAQQSTGEWSLFDLSSGQSLIAPDTVTLYSPFASAPPAATVTLGDGQDADVLQRLDPQGNPLGDPVNIGYSLRLVLLSPNGQDLAYQPYDVQTSLYDMGIQVLQNGQASTVPLPANANLYTMVWGPLTWGAGAATSGTAFDCPGALPPRLTAGAQGRVTATGGANNLRANASKDAAIIGQIPAGDVFVVAGAPACVDGVIWWMVNYNGQNGWTAESENGVYYLEPVQ